MRRQIRWTERCEDGTKIDIRVSFNAGVVKWQFKRTGAAQWDYDTPPTEAQWDELETRLGNRLQRGHVAITRELDMVRQQRRSDSGVDPQ